MPTLDWIGKDAVRRHHQEVPFRLLEEQEEMQVGDPEAENLLIQGDNLHALKALLPYYAGEVDCVYIDPPYNIGSGDWEYNDKVDSPEIREWLGETVGGEVEDLSRHDKWLCMMYPRVTLLHRLLSDDGSLWMNIDDNEVAHARCLLDEVFGRANFVANVVWQKRTSPDSRVDLGAAHDHILVYAKNKDNVDFNKVPRTGDQDDYSNPDNDPRGDWASRDFTAQGHRPNQMYKIETPVGEVYEPPPDRCWAKVKSEFEKLREDNRIWFGMEGKSRPRKKKFLHESEGVSSWTWWNNDNVGHNQEATKELKRILPEVDSGKHTPKPTQLIKHILTIATDPGDIVLDSFAGTGSTGHATMIKNKEDVGNRNFVLVEMNDEIAEDVAHKRLQRVVEGYEYEGTEKETIMEKKLTVSNFRKGNKIYAESEEIKNNKKDEYDKIRREADEGMFRLYGENNIEERKEGIGGGFRYATLGPPLVTGGFVSDEVKYEDLARHVFYMETGDALPESHEMSPPLVSVQNGMALYLLYGEESGVLTRSLLENLSTNGEAQSTVVYGDACRVGEAVLRERGITFRQVPYEVRVS